MALSPDGSTAVIGAPDDTFGAGAAWTFSRSGTEWNRQAKLTSARGGFNFGNRVALSSDGNTILIGGQSGTAWVFTRLGSTWSQQAELGAELSVSLALSSDGNTALIGAPGNTERAFVYTRSGSAWTRQATLSGGTGTFGVSVALSSDGNTALVGSPSEAAVWVFTRSVSTWSLSTKLTAAANGFGQSLALSSDASTALIGSPGDPFVEAAAAGAAFVFARQGSTWKQQSELSGGKRCDFGDSVGLSSDGNTALVSNNALAAWMFTRSGEAWQQRDEANLGGGPGEERGEPPARGDNVALSGDGGTALVGMPFLENQRGVAAVFAFHESKLSLQTELTGGGPAFVFKLSPKRGPRAGGTAVTITGSGFLGAKSVKFGSAPAKFKVEPGRISAVSPPGSGAVDVTVTTPNGTSSPQRKDLFRYRH